MVVTKNFVNKYMSLLYKSKEDVKTSIEIKDVENSEHEKIIHFYADCGKHGTYELLASFKLTNKRLLQILSEREDITDEELNC